MSFSFFVVAPAGQGCQIRIMGNPALKVAGGNISYWLALQRRAWSSEILSDWQWRRCNWAPQLNAMSGVPSSPSEESQTLEVFLSRGRWMVLDINICGRTESPLLWYQCCQSVTQLDKLFFVIRILWLLCAADPDPAITVWALKSHSNMCAYVESGFNLKWLI